MKSKLYSLTFLFAAVTVLLISCKSAGKMYSKGNYEAAVELAAKKLAKKPNDADLIEVIQNAYRYAVEDHESRVRTLSNTTSDLRFEQIYQEYSVLQSLYNSIRSSPAALEVVKPADYSSYLLTYQEEASNARVKRGDALLNLNNKLSSRDAFFEFQRALALKPGDLTIRQRMDEAYALAVTNIVIEPLTRFGYQYTSFNYDYNNFNYNTLQYLMNNRANQFIQYLTPSDAMASGAHVDNAVELKFSDVNIGQYRDQRSTREVSRQVVSKEIVISKDSVRKEYTTVKARITTTRRALSADGLLQATARNSQNQWIWSDTYRGEYHWEASFSTYTGDERALSDADKKELAQRESYPPSNDQIINLIMNEIQRKAECGISDFFNRLR
ncbi:MAG: hypothetical protein EOO09_03925 [Chitinophagaceae bacterium]|nr:MAG: hypothetical protein EOO09_03925 [Chitinophagaceae bacterium]